MILKASQRGGGQDLAVHLMRLDENEHVLVQELRGFTSDDLRGAFKEAEAISRATKCRQYLFSVSLNPPEQEALAAEAFIETADRIEARLGLQGQPRALIIHEKEGRRHAHAVWSRIDADTMTARQMSFFKTKLQGLSRELYLEHGWDMPRGLASPGQRNPTNFTLAEWQQAKRQGIDPRDLKSTLQSCWQQADSRKAFESALEARGFFLAKGDRRGFVVLDHHGEVHSLPRMLDLKTKDIGARLGQSQSLTSVDACRKQIGERMTPAIRRHVAESRERFREHAEVLLRKRLEITRLHRDARAQLSGRHQREWESETKQRAARLPKGFRGLWHRITGKYQEVRSTNEREAASSRDRQAKERLEQVEQQLEQRRVLQLRIKDLRQRQAAQLYELRKDIGRFLALTRAEPVRAPTRERRTSIGLKLER